MAQRGLKAMTRDSAPKFGHFVVEFATPGIGHVLKAAGCEFVLFDMEHSGFGYETLKNALRWFEAADLPVIVRPPSDAYSHVARAMDMGAEGIMAPMTGTADQARRILDAMKYYPEGERGVALQVAHDRYRPGPVPEKFAAANARSTMFCLIETAEGVENVAEIAALEGVDCLWIGHFDLSVSLGVPGDFAHPVFRAAIERVTAAARANGKSLGRMCSSVEEGVALHAAGFDFIIYSGDVWVLRDGLSAALAGLRAGCGAG
jgi:2-keto-3-deoxy-L-rhamnonate aldolase RhmA